MEKEKYKKEAPLVSLAVMAFNSRKYYGEKYEKNKQYLKALLESVKKQTYPNLEIFVVDDCSEEDLSEEIKAVLPQARIIRNEKNLGLLKSENKAIRMSKGKYIALLNQDLILEENYIESLAGAMEEDDKIGVISGKTRMFFVDENNNSIFTNYIDSAGMLFYKDRNIIERGRMEEDSGQYNVRKEMFGVTGAAPLYRREALENVAIEGEYYDEDFWMYKDDVDLCWRLNLGGWKCVYSPQALAYHARSAGGIAKEYRKNFISRRIGYIIHRILKKGSGSAATRRRDFRNHFWMMVKNDTWQSLLKSAIPFLWREFQKFAFGCAFEQAVYFPGWMDFFKGLKKMLKKRRIIQSRRLIGWRAMEEKFEKGIW